MATPLEPKEIKNLGIYGVIRQAEVDDFLIPEGAVTEAVNFHFDRKGASIVRPGMTTIGGTVTTTDSYPCVGLHNAQSGTLIAVFSGGGSSRIYSLSSGAWGTSLSGGTASVRIRFIDFGSFTISPNFLYNTLSSMVFWGAGADGSSYWKTTGNPINPQNMWGFNPQVIEVFKSRVYLSGDTATNGVGTAATNAPNPSRLYFSSVISSTGNITWTPTTDFVDINPGDGENITALKRFSVELLVFKPNYMYRFRTSSVDPDPHIRIGTRSQESIVEGKRGLYYHHDTGFYRYSGGYPVEISRPISDVIQAIPFGQYASIAAWKDDDHIYWSIGNLTIADTVGTSTWRNVVARYTESSDIWTIYSMARDIRRGGPFLTGTSSSIVIGTDHGVVAQFGVNTTDLLEPIKYRMRTKWYDWRAISSRKVIETISAICDKAQASELMYQADAENSSWESIGQIRKFINYYYPLKIRFHRIRFQVTGVSRDEPPIFRGLEVLEGINEGLVKEVVKQ